MAAQDNSTQQSIYDTPYNTPGQAPDVHVDREEGHSK